MRCVYIYIYHAPMDTLTVRGMLHSIAQPTTEHAAFHARKCVGTTFQNNVYICTQVSVYTIHPRIAPHTIITRARNAPRRSFASACAANVFNGLRKIPF